VSVEGEMAAVLPVGLARNPNRWVCWWGAAAHGEPRTVCVRPPHLFICASDRGPPTMRRLGAPDQGAREQGSDRVVGLGPGDQPNNFMTCRLPFCVACRSVHCSASLFL
jgi:hypothetical protein